MCKGGKDFRKLQEKSTLFSWCLFILLLLYNNGTKVRQHYFLFILFIFKCSAFEYPSAWFEHEQEGTLLKSSSGVIFCIIGLIWLVAWPRAGRRILNGSFYSCPFHYLSLSPACARERDWRPKGVSQGAWPFHPKLPLSLPAEQITRRMVRVALARAERLGFSLPPSLRLPGYCSVHLNPLVGEEPCLVTSTDI